MYIDGTVIGVWALSVTALVMAMAAKVKFEDLEDEIAALRGKMRAESEKNLVLGDLLSDLWKSVDELKKGGMNG